MFINNFNTICVLTGIYMDNCTLSVIFQPNNIMLVYFHIDTASLMPPCKNMSVYTQIRYAA